MNWKCLRIAVAGGGSWGTALAHVLASAGHKVSLVLRDTKLASIINTQHENSRYLPGRTLHMAVHATTDINIFSTQDCIVLAIPCQQLRAYLQSIEPYITENCIFINTSKGLESCGFSSMRQTVQDILLHKSPHYAVLSGPSFAAEVMDHQPTAVVLACQDDLLGQHLRTVFSTTTFRCYSSNDVTGVELGGALKNVIAIAAGVCDGMGLGDNARAALLTRGLAEMCRIGTARGAQPMTFMGLSGLGDLALTCAGNLSRNRQVGLRLGKGENLDVIVQSLGMVAEGVKTTEAVYHMAKSLNISVPITESMYSIMYKNNSPQVCVRELMGRSLKEEYI